MTKAVKIYVDDVFTCAIPVARLEGMLTALRKKGIFNVRTIEE